MGSVTRAMQILRDERQKINTMIAGLEGLLERM